MILTDDMILVDDYIQTCAGIGEWRVGSANAAQYPLFTEVIHNHQYCSANEISDVDIHARAHSKDQCIS